MAKKKYNILFDETIAFNNNNVTTKNDALNFIIDKRSNGIVKKIEKSSNETSDIYFFYIDDCIIEVEIPYGKLNIIYKEEIEKMYALERKKFKLRLRFMTLALTTAFTSGVALSSPIKKVAEEIGNYIEIDNLESELKDHTGYTTFDGESRPISESQHMENGCSFGDYIINIEQEIKQYCNEKGLGQEVAEAAIEKYEHLSDKKLSAANEIDLYKVYIKSKKVKSPN